MFHRFQNMDDDCDFAAVLKQLDELDKKHYSPQQNKLEVKESNAMSVPLDTDLNSNASDFDHSDEDLASLLADDDEDIFSKKTFSNSPSKKKPAEITTLDYSPEKSAVHSSSVTGKLRKDSYAEIGLSDEKSLSSKDSPKRTLDKFQSKEDDDEDSDALNDILSDSTLPSFLKKKTLPSKESSKIVSETFSKAPDDLENDVLKSLETDNKAASRKTKDSFFDSFFKNLSSPKDSPEKLAAGSSPDKKSTQIDIKDDDDDDILKSLKSDEKTSSRKKSDSYLDSFLKNVSPKNSPKKTLIKNEKSDMKTKDDSDIDDDDDDDLLKSLDSDDEKSPRKRSNSYFDSFLKNISPKNSPKKSLMKNEDKKQNVAKNKELENEEDVFGKSILSDTKKGSSAVPKHTTPEKRKTLLKQVSFKGIPDTFPENSSPVKENSLFSSKQQPDSETKTKPTSQPKRSERMGASNKDDTDWLSFFKESPKKSKRPTEPIMQTIDNTIAPETTAADFKSSANRRRSSSAEWLGLSESDIVAKSNKPVAIKGNIIREKDSDDDYLASGEPVKIIRPKSNPEASSRFKIKEDSHTNLSWLTKDKNSMNELSQNITDSNQFPTDKRPLHMGEGDGISIASVINDCRDSTQVASSGILQNFPKKEANVQHTRFTLRNEPAIVHLPVATEQTTDIPAVRALPITLESGQNFNDPTSTAFSLQAIINNHILERDQLIKSSEAMKQMYEERIMTIENLHKNQVKSSEDSIKVLETKLKSEMNSQAHSTEEKLKLLQNEKKQLEKDFKDKLEDLEKQNLKEIERLNELHNQSVALMKQDHEDALQRLKRLKEQEIEAVLSTQTQSRSLQHLTEQLEARASELASLQSKVEERNQATLREKQALLEAKERDLKNLQSRVERQLEEGDSERSRLQQLVLRLESRLQKYTMEGEEDRWEVQQMKARLSVQQKHLDEEYKMQVQQVEREKEKLRLAQDSLLQEQKTVLVQLAQERQQLMREKMDMESVAKKLKEEENIFHVKRMKEESFLESQRQFIQQEESRLRFEKSNIKQEAELLERERESLQRERQLLNEEKLKINEFSFKVKRREAEVEMMALSAAEDKERSQAEHASAFKIKAEQQSRMQHIAQKMQDVMEKEQQILAEKEKLFEEKLDLENNKKSILCNKCKLSLGLPVHVPPPNTHPVTMNAPIANFPLSNEVSNHLGTLHHDPSLVVWYITAQRDREYLQEELTFLRSLKDSTQKKF